MRPTTHATPRRPGEVDKWLDFLLLLMSGTAIMGVVMWTQSALSG